ncbi:hypothetical protein Lsed01_02080 [Demequina sediminis]|uniref:Uncharacterized protein n=1 Tax=Demequina sediminis TaxID=1930058 RepID=A0ABP9WJ57_9MICO|nr:hypothetical protein [Demequina sediminis]BDZ61554.1 hypothetical protein GCM10025873_13450 [Demequina sediminis]
MANSYKTPFPSPRAAMRPGADLLAKCTARGSPKPPHAVHPCRQRDACHVTSQPTKSEELNH